MIKHHKLQHLRDLALEGDLLFLAITETWLHSGILDAEVKIEGYQLVRQDRVDRIHGGVALWVKEGFTVKEIWKTSNSYIESLLVEISELKTVLSVMYRPPGCPESLLNDIVNMTSESFNIYESSRKGHNMIALGDLNFPFVQSFNKFPENLYNSVENERKSSVCYKKFMEQHMLSQLETDPTRGENHLDVIMVSEDGLVSDPAVTINKTLSDHNTINFGINSKFMSEPEDDEDEHENTLDKLNQDFDDETLWNRMNMFIDSVDWEEALRNKDTNTAWETLSKKIIEAIKIFAPLKKGKTESFNKDDKNTPKPKKGKKKLIPKTVRILFRKKRRITKAILQEKISQS